MCRITICRFIKVAHCRKIIGKIEDLLKLTQRVSGVWNVCNAVISVVKLKAGATQPEVLTDKEMYDCF